MAKHIVEHITKYADSSFTHFYHHYLVLQSHSIFISLGSCGDSVEASNRRPYFILNYTDGFSDPLRKSTEVGMAASLHPWSIQYSLKTQHTL